MVQKCAMCGWNEKLAADLRAELTTRYIEKGELVAALMYALESLEYSLGGWAQFNPVVIRLRSALAKLGARRERWDRD